MPCGLFYHDYLDRFISNGKGVKLLFFITTMFIEIHVLNANSVNPNQTPRSDLGLHCLPGPFNEAAGVNGLNLTKLVLIAMWWPYNVSPYFIIV